jgi:hypothetical protein
LASISTTSLRRLSLRLNNLQARAHDVIGTTEVVCGQAGEVLPGISGITAEDVNDVLLQPDTKVIEHVVLRPSKQDKRSWVALSALMKQLSKKRYVSICLFVLDVAKESSIHLSSESTFGRGSSLIEVSLELVG